MSRVPTLIRFGFHPACPAGLSLALVLAVVLRVPEATEPGRRAQDIDGAAPPESVLTVVVRPDSEGALEEGVPSALDREIALGVARLDGRRVRLVLEDDETRMVDDLVAGRIDFVAAPLAVTAGRCDRVAFSLVYAAGDGLRPLAVAVRPDDDRLRRLANEFLISRALVGQDDNVHSDDLDGILARGELRVLTERGPASYFVHDGQERGFEYELMKIFADRHGLELKVVVPPTRSDLVRWLREGKGDVIASAFEVLPERKTDVAYTRPYQNSYQAMVVRENDRVRDLDDLRGRIVYVRAGSAECETLRELRQSEDDFEIRIVSESFGLEEILGLVEDGTWDVTVCDSELLDMERAAGIKLRSAFPIRLVRRAWAVRPDNPKLRASLDGFLREEYRGLHFNVLRQSYFEGGPMTASFHDDFRSDLSGRISVYDDLIRRYAEECNLDWRLVAAQIYQESRFNHDSVSGAGAVGLMQLMPATASDLGVQAVNDPETSIRAGTRYLKKLLDTFEPDLPLEARIRFALASYNVGRGHVEDARRLAARRGWSPDRWYGNVEKALLLLQRAEYYRSARHGYCRGKETIQYVARIDRLYRTYVENVRVGPAVAAEQAPGREGDLSRRRPEPVATATG